MTSTASNLLTAQDQITLRLLPDELWWGGAADDGNHMPYGRRSFVRDLAQATPDADIPNMGRPSNQSAPVLVSSRGRVIGSHRPFRFTFDTESVTATGNAIVQIETGGTLRDAYLAAVERFFPASGKHPAIQLFLNPQYNTWIEQPHRPTQESVLRYAQGIIDAGMAPGTLIIDDSWAPDYGTWHFDTSRFPDPRGMVTTLHEWGFSVMLWLVPFVSPDSAAFRGLEADRLLLRDVHGDTAVRRWWNGYSAVLDVSNPEAITWLTEQLDALVDDIAIDGFKFDGGDIRDFREDDVTAAGYSPTDMCEAWARVGLKYAFNEYRACWRLGGQPLGQRLQDKPPTWDVQGIGSLIPEMVAQGLIGHPFVCPDMIGGGEISAVSGQPTVDQEFFVRYAQIAAFSPMAQFSVAPARVLDSEHLGAVEAALNVRAALLPLLRDLIEQAATTGEPIVRAMGYHAPALAAVSDQFFLGPDLIVAPVVNPGQAVRQAHLPEGQWVAVDGGIHVGPTVVETICELSTIPWFVRAESPHAPGVVLR